MGGFIDPDATSRAAMERLGTLVAEAFKTVPVESLSPKAREALESLRAGDEGRRNRALFRIHRSMAEDLPPGALHADECEWERCPFSQAEARHAEGGED